VNDNDGEAADVHNSSAPVGKYENGKGSLHRSNSLPVGRYENGRGSLHRSYSLSSAGDGSSIVSYESENVVTGAGTDALAVQDAGSHRFILDDCSYLCSSFLSCKKEQSFTSEDEVGGEQMFTMTHNVITADAAVKLAVMLSSMKTRSVLLSLGGSHGEKESGKHGKEDGVDNNGILQSLLNVFGCVPTALIGTTLPTSVVVMESTDWDEMKKERIEETCSNYELMSGNTAERRSRTRNGRTKMVVNDGKKLTTPVSRKIEGGALPNQHKIDCPLSLNQYESSVTLALAILAHYVSFDCTCSSKHSAANNLVAGRGIRRSMLRHKEAICGISRLLLADPIVSSILKMRYSPIKASPDYSIEEQTVPTVNIQELGTNIEGVGRNDPTKMGRKKKNRRKYVLTEMGGEGTTKHPDLLDTLQEETPSHSNRKGQDDDTIISSIKVDEGSKSTCTSNGLEFSPNDKITISETTTRSSSDMNKMQYLNEIPRKFRRNFEKLLSRIAKSADVKSASHVVDGKQSGLLSKRSGCAYCQRDMSNSSSTDSSPDLSQTNPGLLALDALNRILTGNAGDKIEEDEQPLEENNDTDCYTDEKNGSLKENDSSKEDLSNPLIYKNVMLRRSGSIYFLARAIVESFEALSCIIIG